MLKLKYISIFYWSCDYFKLYNWSINTKHYRQGYSYKIYMKSECKPLKSPTLFPTEQANIYIKYRTNSACHCWWHSCFVMTICLKFLLLFSLLLHSTPCSSYPQLPYSVPLPFVTLFGSPFQIKSICICSTSQSCLSDHCSHSAFVSAFLLIWNKKVSQSSGICEPRMAKRHIGIYTQDASYCKTLKASHDPLAQQNHLQAICSCVSTYTFPSWRDLEVFQSLSIVTVLL